MRRVFHADYLGDLGPMDFERGQLELIGAELVAARCAGQDELIQKAAGAEVIWLEWVPSVDERVLRALPDCRLVMRWGAGYDQIDVRAATELGVAVANAPTYCTENVAEHAMALLLTMTRGVAVRAAAMRAGGWRDPAYPHQRLAGRTLGIIGLGRIGRRVAELGAAFGCRVIAHDVRTDLVPPDGVALTGLAELLAEADFVSLHTVLNEGSRHLINASSLAGAKPGMLLVNTSRGGVVDQDALLAAIESGIVAGAGLDVFETEPLPPESALRSCPAVVLTPHEASTSAEADDDLRAEMCQATAQWFATGWTDSVVNPEVRSRLRAEPAGGS
jgi:D-3-phosphoglycerate dehydrogenase / 2-oxoglutarate reductase